MLPLGGLFENLLVAGPLLVLILMPAGLIASAWVTNTVFDYFRSDEETTTKAERFGAFMLLSVLFISYCHFVASLFSY